MFQVFTDKYFPDSFEEFAGNGNAVQAVKNWCTGWENGEIQKPLLFNGPPGVGKTCLALLAAKEFDWNVFELNASDLRNKDRIERIVGAAALNESFSGKRRLVLMDEVDGIQGRKDRGGVSAIGKIIKETRNPMILTANKVYTKDRKLDAIKYACIDVKFSRVPSPSMAKRLRAVCEAEKIDYDQEVLKRLAELSSGDMRAALLDLQNLSSIDNKIVLDDVESASNREREADVFKVIGKIFKSRNILEIRSLKAHADIDHGMVKKWVEENIPRIYKDDDLIKGMEVLSRADVFDGRIFRRQHWGFLRYSGELVSSGVALAKEGTYGGWLQLQFPGILRKLSSSKGERAIKKSIASKMSKKIHTSSKQIISQDLPFIEMAFEDRQVAAEYSALFDFDDKEIAFLMSTKPATKKVQKIFEEAKELRKQLVKPKKIEFFESKEPDEDEKPEPKQQPLSSEQGQTSLGNF